MDKIKKIKMFDKWVDISEKDWNIFNDAGMIKDNILDRGFLDFLSIKLPADILDEMVNAGEDSLNKEVK